VESLRILVTGGAGFIGSHLVKALVKAGHCVRVLDNFSTGSLENLGDIAGSVELVVGDVRSYGVVEKAVKGVDAVIHLAALIDVAESIEKPDLYFDVNARGTYNIAKACKGVSVLVFASTCAVYGEPVKLPVAEDCTIAPKSPYAATKVAGEAFIQAYSNLYGYRYAILRLFNVYGPKQSKAYAGVIIEFIKRVSRGEPPIIFGDGEQTRDFIHVSDVVEAIIMAITNERARGVFNIGSGKPVTINQLAKLILKLMGKEDLKPVNTTPRPGDIRHSVADITRAREVLGFKPRIGLEEGLQSLITTYTHQQKHYNSTHCR
jgi:UDP-glucose 4-epimerase